MKIASGVEWAAHACALLAMLPKGASLSAEALANYHDVPPAYMAKQMQALRRAGLIVSQRGAVGGYRLAATPNDINLWDITEAIEGSAPSFKCTEIRQNGPCGAAKENCKKPCGIAASFYAAEQAFRSELKKVLLSDLLMQIARDTKPDNVETLRQWLNENAALTPS
jgi:Rrf2 family protein